MCAQIDGHNPVPLLWGSISQPATQPDANIANQAVECSRISNEAGTYIGISDVSLEHGRGTTLGHNCCGGAFGGFEMQIGADHLSALPGGKTRDCLPIPRGITLTLKARTSRANHQNASTDETTTPGCLPAPRLSVRAFHHGLSWCGSLSFP